HLARRLDRRRKLLPQPGMLGLEGNARIDASLGARIGGGVCARGFHRGDGTRPVLEAATDRLRGVATIADGDQPMTSPMTLAKDPVCGMEVEIEGAKLTFEYKGTTYYFCSRGCLLDFREDPEMYLDPRYEASM